MRSPLRHLKKTGTEFITEGVDDPAANQQLAEARPYTAKALQQIYRPGYLIDPRHSKVMGSWDIIMLVALMFTAIVTPYEVTFIEEGPCVTILFMVNRFIDLLFLMDMCAAKLWRARSLLPSIHTCYCVRPLLVHTLSFLPTPGTPGTPGSIVTRTRFSIMMRSQLHHLQPRLSRAVRRLGLLAQGHHHALCDRFLHN
jgi:hypothetical protein